VILLFGPYPNQVDRTETSNATISYQVPEGSFAKGSFGPTILGIF